MDRFDLVIRGGTVATAADTFPSDVGIRDGKIAALAQGLDEGRDEIDATGRLVLPGGIDSHCHIEQWSASGLLCADDFYTGSVSAAFGGTTTIIPFAAQHRGQSLREVVEAYHGCADPKAVIDYAFHLIISDPTAQVLGQELPALIEDGYTSFKVYMTYDLLQLDDYQMLDVLALARREGAMTMVHAENHDMIRWLTDRLLDGGYRAPKYHAVSHARVAEGEATSRAIDLARLVDVPMLIVHVSAAEAIDAIRHAQDLGLRIHGETCPQYLFLTAADLDRDGMEGAKFCCSPPPRDAANQEHVWRGLVNGTFQVFSSDHAPYRFDETGKLAAGPDAPFKKIANGVPGLELPPAAALLRGGRPRADRSQPLRGAGPRPTRRGSTGCIRARARSRSAPTRTWRSGTPTERSRSPGTPCTTTSGTPLTRGDASRDGRSPCSPAGAGSSMAARCTSSGAAESSCAAGARKPPARSGAGCRRWTRRRTSARRSESAAACVRRKSAPSGREAAPHEH